MPGKKITEVTGKTVEEITTPTPIETTLKAAGPVWEFQGREFAILPVPDAVLQSTLGQIAETLTVIFGVSAKPEGEGTEPEDVRKTLTDAAKKMTTNDLIAAIPQIAHVLLPNSTQIIASSLAAAELKMLNDESMDLANYRKRQRVSADWVDDNLFRAQRLEVLGKILQAEDIPSLVANFEKLVAMFQGPTPATPTS